MKWFNRKRYEDIEIIVGVNFFQQKQISCICHEVMTFQVHLLLLSIVLKKYNETF